MELRIASSARQLVVESILGICNEQCWLGKSLQHSRIQVPAKLGFPRRYATFLFCGYNQQHKWSHQLLSWCAKLYRLSCAQQRKAWFQFWHPFLRGVSKFVVVEVVAVTCLKEKSADCTSTEQNYQKPHQHHLHSWASKRWTEPLT